MTAPQLVVEVDRVLPAAPATVFKALTDASLFSMWMGPAGSTIAVEELDARVDGRLSFRIKLPDDGPEFHLYGAYLDVQPGRRIVHTWFLEGEDVESTVAFDLEEVAGGTRLAITHTGLSADEIDQNDAGWRHQLDRLEEALAKIAA